MPKNYSQDDLLEILYNAVGRAGEIATKSAFTLQLDASYKNGKVKTDGSSGYTVGIFQYDFGQRPNLKSTDPNAPGIHSLINAYNAWATGNGQDALTADEQRKLIKDLAARGPAFDGDQEKPSSKYMPPGDPLRAKIDRFLTSDTGLRYVDKLDASVLNTSPGYPGLLDFARRVADSPTVRNMSEKDSEFAIATLSKVFNQHHGVAEDILGGLKGQSMDSEQFNAYVASMIDHSKHKCDKPALHKGVAATIHGIKVIDEIRSSPTLGPLWSASAGQDPSLEKDFSKSPAKQLFDAMLRNPGAGERVVAALDSGKGALISTSKESAKETYIAGVAKDGTLFTMDQHGTGQGYVNGNWVPFTNGGDFAERDRNGHWTIASHSTVDHLALDSKSTGATTSNDHLLVEGGASNPLFGYLQLAAEVSKDTEALSVNQANSRSFRLN